MPTSKRIKTAVFGCGQISEVYLENMMNRFSCLDVVACCSKNGASAKKRAEQFGIKAMSAEEIFADSSIELIVNLTPANEHYDIIKMSLEAGKNVYTEKILTPSYDKAKELCELAKEKNLRIGCAPDTFLGSAIQTAKKAIERGEIGQIMSCSANLNRDCTCSYTPGRFTTLKGGGVGFDVGIYYITAILSILGSASKACGFCLNTTPEYVVEDSSSQYFGQKCIVDNENIMIGNVLFRNGVATTLHFCGRTIYPETPSIIFYGTKGIIILPDPNCFGGKVLIMRKGESNYSELENEFFFDDNSRGLGVAEMAWSIMQNRPHRASVEMATHAVEILCAIEKSSETGITQLIYSEFTPSLPLKPKYECEREEDSIK